MKSGIVTQSDKPHEAMIVWRRWLPLVIIVCILFVVSAFDRRLKVSEFNGFVSQDASWSVSIDDVGGSWEALLGTETWAGISAKKGDPLRETWINLRKSLGIRVSPARWNTWLGSKAVVSGLDGEAGITVKPGLLFRLVRFGSRVVGEGAEPGVYAYGGLYYAWRDGFVCISKSQVFVEYMLTDDVVFQSENDSPESIMVRLSDPYVLECTIGMAEGLPVGGWLGYSVTPMQVPLGVVSGSVGRDSLTISGARPYEWFPLVDELMPDWPNLKLVRDMFAGTEERVQAYRVSGFSGNTWVLDDLLTDHFLAAPVFTIAGVDQLREAELSGEDPYHRAQHWGDYEGWKDPWFGHRYEWCAANGEGGYVMTNQSSHLSRNFGRWSWGAPMEADVMISLHYPAFSGLLKPLVVQAADQGYIEGMDGGAVAEDRSLYWSMLAGMGTARLEGTVVEDGISFSGFLGGGDDRASSSTGGGVSMYTSLSEDEDSSVTQEASADTITVSLETSGFRSFPANRFEINEKVKGLLSLLHIMQDDASGALVTNSSDSYVSPIVAIPKAASSVYAFGLAGQYQRAEHLLNFMLEQVYWKTDDLYPLGSVPGAVYPTGEPATPHYKIDLLSAASVIWAVESYSTTKDRDEQRAFCRNQWESVELMADFLEHWVQPALVTRGDRPSVEGSGLDKRSYDIASAYLGLDKAIGVAERAGYAVPESWVRTRQRCSLYLGRRGLHYYAPWDIQFSQQGGQVIQASALPNRQALEEELKGASGMEKLYYLASLGYQHRSAHGSAERLSFPLRPVTDAYLERLAFSEELENSSVNLSMLLFVVYQNYQ